MATLERLRLRQDFQRLSSQGRKYATRSMVILAMSNSVDLSSDVCRIGFTTTRKLGGAVVRNRIRRRLREAARMVFSQLAKPGYDYVIIARPSALTCAFSILQDEMRLALHKMHPEACVC
jgi:ribonuclease P protein component